MNVYYSSVKSLKELVEKGFMERYNRKTGSDVSIATFSFMFSLIESGGMAVDEDTTITDIGEYVGTLYEADKDQTASVIRKMLEDGLILQRKFDETDGPIEYTDVVSTDENGQIRIHSYQCNGAA